MVIGKKYKVTYKPYIGFDKIETIIGFYAGPSLMYLSAIVSSSYVKFATGTRSKRGSCYHILLSGILSIEPVNDYVWYARETLKYSKLNVRTRTGSRQKTTEEKIKSAIWGWKTLRPGLI